MRCELVVGDGSGRPPRLALRPVVSGVTDAVWAPKAYVGLYGVNANGTVTETAAAQCLDTSFQPFATPVGEDIPYSWGDPVRNRAGQLVGKFSVFQLIGGENPDGSIWYGGELDNSVAGPVQR